MSFFKSLSQREQIMLGLLCLVLFGTGYALLRYQPAQAHITQLENQTTNSKKKLLAIKFPKEPSKDRATLERQLATLEEEVAEKLIELDRLEQQFIPSEAPEAVQGLKVSISSLAKKHHVRIRESRPYDPARARLASSRSPRGTRRFVGQPSEVSLIQRFQKGNPYQRPLLQITTESGYAGLRRFIEELAHLPWRVTIAQFSLEAATSTTTEPTTQQISSTLILAL